VPLKLNVGVSRKVGLPDYGSAGATCGVEVELDPDLLRGDLDGFHERVRSAYVACHQAVNDELARLNVAPGPAAEMRPAPVALARCNGPPPVANGRVRTRKPATANQVRAIAALARRQEVDLDGWLRAGYGVGRPEDLSLAEASRLIDELKAGAGA
jgi:hypothetical protein